MPRLRITRKRLFVKGQLIAAALLVILLLVAPFLPVTVSP